MWETSICALWALLSAHCKSEEASPNLFLQKQESKRRLFVVGWRTHDWSSAAATEQLLEDRDHLQQQSEKCGNFLRRYPDLLVLCITVQCVNDPWIMRKWDLPITGHYSSNVYWRTKYAKQLRIQMCEWLFQNLVVLESYRGRVKRFYLSAAFPSW